ncbi:epsin/ent-related [Holotrichia oblita]|uniref:Epsin/ent-related n=2 Tax=Holotrichia oblita TaxID=644536 RepID=A0ACB9SUA0_HOLOL|nr:epsin/ent-related [Holotrichia oblita]KAI4457137.1 epsin/ent-related [Holotrichia oblita]
MQVNVAGIRRNLRNIVHNYSDAQRKVREATSNDAWGPSSTIMAEIADLTYNVVAFTEIMQMIWKRLNDHGKNWRHVYKALVLLEYLIKTGSEKVAHQCNENIYFIKTLKDFQYLEEGKDQGQNVREKAKQLANLLQDDERLRNERARALKAKERFAQSASGFGSDGGLDTPSSPKFPAFRGEWSSNRDSGELPRDLEVARPQTAGEEELQLQLALAMSREEAEQEEQKRRSDDVRLQLALSQSQQDFKASQDKHPAHSQNIVDLLDVNLGESAPPTVDPWGLPQPPAQNFLPFSQQNTSPWRGNTTSPPLTQPPPGPLDPWKPVSSMSPRPQVDPWNSTAKPQAGAPLVETAIRNDPWSPDSHSSSTDLDEFDAITNRNRTTSPKTNGTSTAQVSDPFEFNLLGDALPTNAGPSPSTGATKKTPQSFLGENSALVNLDNLVTNKTATNSNTANPFSDAQTNQPPRQVFSSQAPKPSMNEIKQGPFMGSPQFGVSAAPAYSTGSAMGAGVPPAYVTPMPPTTGLPPYPTANGAQFGAPSPSFGANGTFGATVPQMQDPWQPVPSNNNNSQLGAPWMKPGETANPFLS